MKTRRGVIPRILIVFLGWISLIRRCAHVGCDVTPGICLSSCIFLSLSFSLCCCVSFLQCCSACRYLSLSVHLSFCLYVCVSVCSLLFCRGCNLLGSSLKADKSVERFQSNT